VTLTPDGAHAYVINQCSLSLIDTAINESTRIVVGDLPRCVPVSPDGKRAYVSGFGDHTVSVIDAITHRVTNALDVGSHPVRIGSQSRWRTAPTSVTTGRARSA
jgi:YVTN family beta-propeller protein